VRKFGKRLIANLETRGFRKGLEMGRSYLCVEERQWGAVALEMYGNEKLERRTERAVYG
jgi:hypothetical protein